MKKDLWQYLETAEKPIVLYGMGNGADKIINILNSRGIKISGVFASDGFVRKKTFHGFQIETYAEIKERLGSVIVLVCFGSSLTDVIANIERIAKEQELYAPEVPVYGGGLFTLDYARKNRDRFEKIYNILADKLSRKTFECIVNYKLSGDIKFLKACEVTPDEPFENILKLSDKETYIDLGAYTGDTVKQFTTAVSGKYRKIYAVEPDKKTFSRLKANTSCTKDIELINACISDKCGTLTFKNNGGRNSAVDEAGLITDCTTVDAILNGNSATYIKMDVEGEEIAAIRGSERTVKAYKPKMLISCYHRTDDMLSIPEAVFAMHGDYKLFMRHYMYIPAWDTNYFFV